MLRAINTVLADEVRWPTAAERLALREKHGGLFRKIVGVMDGQEHIFKRSEDEEKERRTYSKKKHANTRATLHVIDFRGLFTYVSTTTQDGARNDRQLFTSSPLYLNAGKYFTDDEQVAGDGIFVGNGPVMVSFEVLDTEPKKDFNAAFTEVRREIENSIGRVQLWFPILGSKKKYWPYDEELLELSVGAATKLHNWMMRNRGLDYSAINNPSNFYRNYY